LGRIAYIYMEGSLCVESLDISALRMPLRSS
jgi:hypothetical protein